MFKHGPIIAVEEHYSDPDLLGWGKDFKGLVPPSVGAQLRDIGDERLRSMDEAGIDVQVLSLATPIAGDFASGTAVDLARRANDRLAQACSHHSSRLAAFAALPMQVPDAAAQELQRCIIDLGFKGAMLRPRTDGLFLDDKRFWPVLEMAEKLDVPVYLHPDVPDPDVKRIYYDDYAENFPGLFGAALGFTVETATQAIRLILSGVFYQYTRLNIILGHLGEALPFLLWRTNMALARSEHMRTSFREHFCHHFYLTTSGNFSTPAFHCAAAELGVDRIMFAVDYPFVANRDGLDWIKTMQMPANDLAKLLGGNARRLLRL